MEDVKILMLKNNQHVITKLSEIISEDDKPLCFLFTAPLIISYQPPTEDGEIKISFTLWSPFSKSIQYRIPFDNVITIGDPKDDVLGKYIEIAGPVIDLLDKEEQDENNLPEIEEEE
jgi:hypothetical protein